MPCDRIQVLTPGERHLVARLRRGRTQKERAHELGISLWRYRQWENDETSPPITALLLTEVLSESEEFLIRRVRRGMTRKDLAREMGVSEFWVYQMENGKVANDKLREYWQVTK